MDFVDLKIVGRNKDARMMIDKWEGFEERIYVNYVQEGAARYLSGLVGYSEGGNVVFAIISPVSLFRNGPRAFSHDLREKAQFMGRRCDDVSLQHDVLPLLFGIWVLIIQSRLCYQFSNSGRTRIIQRFHAQSNDAFHLLLYRWSSINVVHCRRRETVERVQVLCLAQWNDNSIFRHLDLYLG